MSFEFTEIDGLKIHFRRHGRAGARKLLLTNALPMSIHTWDEQWERLAEKYELLAIDLPGFGQSAARPELMNPSASAEFLARAIRHFAWEGSVGVGPDVGVPVLLALAQSKPELLRGIAIGDGPGFWPPVLSPDLSMSARSAFFRAFATATFETRVYLAQVFWRANRRAAPSANVYKEYLRENTRAAFRNTMAFLASYPRELRAIGEHLADTQMPTLIFWGERDRFVPLANGEGLHERMPNSKLHVFKGCGHFSHEDAGAEFVDVLAKWESGL